MAICLFIFYLFIYSFIFLICFWYTRLFICLLGNNIRSLLFWTPNVSIRLYFSLRDIISSLVVFLQMHLLVKLYILAIGVILINCEPLEENVQSGSVEMRDSSEDPMISSYKGGPIPLVGLAIKARSHGYCLRRLSSLG